MARKKNEIQPMRPDVPVYPIGVAARLLNIHPRTLRIYEKEGLISPAHSGSRRMFSANDIQWVTCLRSLIHDEGISIPGLKKLLNYAPCWELADCPSEIHERCEALVDKALPRTLHRAGDKTARMKAKNTDHKKQKTAAQKKKHSASG